MKAIEYDEKYSDAYNHLGRLYHSPHQLDKALEYYLKAIQLDSTNSAAFNNLGRLFEDKEKYK